MLILKEQLNWTVQKNKHLISFSELSQYLIFDYLALIIAFYFLLVVCSNELKYNFLISVATIFDNFRSQKMSLLQKLPNVSATFCQLALSAGCCQKVHSTVSPWKALNSVFVSSCFYAVVSSSSCTRKVQNRDQINRIHDPRYTLNMDLQNNWQHLPKWFFVQNTLEW